MLVESAEDVRRSDYRITLRGMQRVLSTCVHTAHNLTWMDADGAENSLSRNRDANQIII